MKLSRWWDLAIAAAVLLCGLILLGGRALASGAGARVGGAAAAGRRPGCSSVAAPVKATALAVAFSVSLVIVSGLVVAAHPVLAIIQCVSYPAVWMLARTTRRAVVFNVAIALAVGVGFLVSTGTTLGRSRPDRPHRRHLARLQPRLRLLDQPHRPPQRGAPAPAREPHRRPGRARDPAPGHRDHQRAGAHGARTPRHDRAEPRRAGAARTALATRARRRHPHRRHARAARDRRPRRARRDPVARRRAARRSS